MGVAIESGSKYIGHLPNTNGSKNEHSRIWGKPIYAIADGKVVHCRNDFPSNPQPVPGGLLYEEAFPDLDDLWRSVGDGNGNFFTIATGDETVLYAHMQPGSLNPQFLHTDATVKAGDFLGLVGNSGHSYGPHLHIHSNKTVAGSTNSWENAPRPMRFHNARAVTWHFVTANAASAPWVALNGRGIPPATAPSGHRIPLSSISATLRYATSPSAIRDSSGSSGTTTPSCVRAMTGYRALVSTWT